MKTFVMSKTIEEIIREYLQQIQQSKNQFQAKHIRDHALNSIEQFYHRSRQTILDTYDQQIQKKNLSKQSEIFLNSIDFDFDHTFESIASLSSTRQTNDNALALCENEILIYSENGNQLRIYSLKSRKQIQTIEFNEQLFIRDLCFVNWLAKCLVVTNESIYLVDYRKLTFELLEFGYDYRCATIDHLHERFYLIKQSTLFKYDKSCLRTNQADQYPIADSYQCESVCLDNQTNESLALLVRDQQSKTSILIYSTSAFSNGYLYKIIVDDCLERNWICSSEEFGWFIRGISSETCFELNHRGLKSFRKFHRYQIRNLIHLTNPHRYLIRTKTEIFLLKKKLNFSIKNL